MFQSYHNLINRMAEVRRDRLQQQQHEQQDSVSTEYLVRNWLEALFAWFQVIVLWHEPRVSLCAITGLLSSFLLLTYFAPRFYATIMIAIFIYNLNKFWFRHLWPEIRVPPESDREEEMRLDVDRWTYLHPQLMTLKELKNHVRNLIKSSEGFLHKLLQLRHRKPAKFCSLLCFVFTCSAYLGNTISGLSLVFITLVVVMSAPGIYAHLLSEEQKHWLQQQYRSFIASSQHHLNQETTEEVPGEQEKEEKEEKLEGEASGQAAQQEPNIVQRSALVSKETIATSLTTTIKSIESLFGNLKKVNPTTAATGPNSADAKIEHQQQHSSSSILTNLREDSAKILYNLIDKSRMGDKNRQQDSAGSSRSQLDEPIKQSSSDASSVAESLSLIDNEEDPQDDGFVML